MLTDAKTHVDHLFSPLVRSFQRHLRAEGKDPDTVAHYVGATRQFLAFCEEEHLPAAENVSREHVELWLERLFEKYRPATVKNRYQGCRAFYDWLTAEGEIVRNPFGAPRDRRIRPPEVPESAKDVVSEADMAKLFAFLDKEKRWRDAALIAILYDTGMRASELADAKVSDLDEETGHLTIEKTKGKRVRVVRLDATTLRYLDRYQRRPRRDPEYLVTGRMGKMRREGVYDAVRRAFEDAGIEGTIGAHDLRHTSATHVALAGVMSESDAMQLYGWREPEMWRHYSAQARRAAALKSHAANSPMAKLKRS